MRGTIITLAAGAAVVCLLSVVYFQAAGNTVLAESGKAERAQENSFFDSLSAKDKAKGIAAKHGITAKQERAEANSFYASIVAPAKKAKVVSKHAAQHKAQVKHAKAHQLRQVVPGVPLDHKTEAKWAAEAQKHRNDQAAYKMRQMEEHHRESMSIAFSKAQEELAHEKAKMRGMEEHDKVSAEEQKMQMQRMSADRQAKAYEHHLHELNRQLFPSAMSAAVRGRASRAVRSALVDDLKKENVKNVEANLVPQRIKDEMKARFAKIRAAKHH